MVLLPGEYHNEFKMVRSSAPARWLAACIALTFRDHADGVVEASVQTTVRPLFSRIKIANQISSERMERFNRTDVGGSDP